MPQEDSTTNLVPTGTPQAQTKRFPWSKPKVQHKPTIKNRVDFKKLAKSGVYPTLPKEGA